MMPERGLGWLLSYVGWLQHCDSFRLYQKYVEPNVEYMHNYYLKWDKFKWLIVTGLVTLILGYLAVSVGLK